MAKKGPARACVIPAEPGGGNRKPIETTVALASTSLKRPSAVSENSSVENPYCSVSLPGIKANICEKHGVSLVC